MELLQEVDVLLVITGGANRLQYPVKSEQHQHDCHEYNAVTQQLLARLFAFFPSTPEKTVDASGSSHILLGLTPFGIGFGGASESVESRPKVLNRMNQFPM